MGGSQSRDEVRRTYDDIAEHFSQTRQSAWPEVAAFIERAGAVNRALDLGCANGRHVPNLRAVADEIVGIDLSREVLTLGEHAWGRNRTAWVQGDALYLPLVDDSIDLCVYIATIHHLPSREERIASLHELARVLRPGARGLVSAWSVSHDRFDAETGEDRIIPWTLPSGRVVDRFYHIYDEIEFGRDLEASPLAVERTFESGGNCYGEIRG